MDHAVIDERSLFLAHHIAARLRQRPVLWKRARANVALWGDSPEHGVRVWRNLIELPPEDILRIYTEDSEKGRQIRQSAPFAGVLDPSERTRLFRQFGNAKSGS